MRDAVAVPTSVPSSKDWVGLVWKSTAWAVLLSTEIDEFQKIYV